MPHRFTAGELLLALSILVFPGRLQPHRMADRRVVDTVSAGNPTSEAAHGFAADQAVTGVAVGRPFRQARGWMHYSLKTFEDTDVTLAFTFAGVDSVSRNYDVVVEDSVVATRSLPALTGGTPMVEVAVPFTLTKGKASIALVLRARGGMTPMLLEVRTIQDHYELNLDQLPSHLTSHLTSDRLQSSLAGSPDRWPHTLGVTR